MGGRWRRPERLGCRAFVDWRHQAGWQPGIVRLVVGGRLSRWLTTTAGSSCSICSGLVVFVACHGVSMFAAFALRQQTDPRAVASTLAVSQRATRLAYLGLLLLIVGGVLAASSTNLWGQAWIIWSVVVLIAVLISMYSLATPYYIRLAPDRRRWAPGRDRRVADGRPGRADPGARQPSARSPVARRRPRDRRPRLAHGPQTRLSEAGRRRRRAPADRHARRDHGSVPMGEPRSPGAASPSGPSVRCDGERSGSLPPNHDVEGTAQ